MHFCQGQIERVKLNHLDNKMCKMKQPASCCASDKEVNHCKDSAKETDEDCCKDLAYADDLQDQNSVDILKITPIDFAFLSSILRIDIPVEITNRRIITPLDFYVQSNAPPLYILHQQRVLYEI